MEDGHPDPAIQARCQTTKPAGLRGSDVPESIDSPAPPPHCSRFSLDYDDERLARIVETSLAREVGEIDDDRSTTSLSRDGRTVEVVVEAADLVALRAACNTWLTLAGVAEETAGAAETVPF